MSHAIQNRHFELIAGHPALDLVNTLDWRFRDDGPEELLPSYDDLLRFCAQSGILTAKQIRQIVRTTTESAAADALVACRELREAAADVLYAAVDDRNPAASQIKSLDRFFKEAREHQRLVLVRVAPGVGMAGLGMRRGAAVVDAVAEHHAPVDLRRYGPSARLREARLPLAVPRHEQESHPPLVRHEDLRKSHESPPLQSHAQRLSGSPAFDAPLNWIRNAYRSKRSGSRRNGRMVRAGSPDAEPPALRSPPRSTCPIASRTCPRRETGIGLR